MLKGHLVRSQLGTGEAISDRAVDLDHAIVQAGNSEGNICSVIILIGEAQVISHQGVAFTFNHGRSQIACQNRSVVDRGHRYSHRNWFAI